MKRCLAVLLALCSLLLMCPAVLAEPAENETTAPESGETLPEAGADTAADGEQSPETEQTPETESAPEQTKPAGPDLSSLDSETAIRTMKVTAAVDENGRAAVTAVVELRIVGTVEELRFSFPKGAKKTDVAGYWGKSEKESGIEYLTVSNRKGFTGTQTFQLSYTISDLVSGGDASQILELPLLSLQDYKIGVLSFSVTMPKSFESKPGFSSGYYNTLVKDLMTVAGEGTVITGQVNEILRDNDTLTMTLVVPEGYFSGNFGESKLSPVMTALVLILLGLAAVYWWRTMKNPPLRVQARTLPPDGVNPSDLPFLLANGSADFNMLVSHWAVLGYVSFYVNKSGNVLLRRRMSMGNERRAYERKLFDLLFGDGELCDGASMRYKKVGEKAMAVIPRYWGKRLYDKRSGAPGLARLLCCLACGFAALLSMDALAPQKLHGVFLFVALIAGFAMGWMVFRASGDYYLNNWIRTGVGVGCGLLLLIIGGAGEATLAALPAVIVTGLLGWQTCHGGLRRPYGDEVIGQALGFRRFLHNAAETHVLQMLRRDPQYFYKLLPYAQAMGQGRRFVALFHDCKLEQCQWYESARGIPTTASAFYDHYVDTLDLLNISLKK